MTLDAEGEKMPLNKEGFIFYKEIGDWRPSLQAVCGLHPSIQSHWAGAGMSSRDTSSPLPLWAAQGWYQYWLFQIIAHSRRIQPPCSILQFLCAALLLLLGQFLVRRHPKWGYCSLADKEVNQAWLCAGGKNACWVWSLHSATAGQINSVFFFFTVKERLRANTVLRANLITREEYKTKELNCAYIHERLWKHTFLNFFSLHSFIIQTCYIVQNKEIMNILILEWTNAFFEKIRSYLWTHPDLLLIKNNSSYYFFFPSQWVYPS